MPYEAELGFKPRQTDSRPSPGCLIPLTRILRVLGYQFLGLLISFNQIWEQGMEIGVKKRHLIIPCPMTAPGTMPGTSRFVELHYNSVPVGNYNQLQENASYLPRNVLWQKDQTVTMYYSPASYYLESSATLPLLTLVPQCSRGKRLQVCLIIRGKDTKIIMIMSIIINISILGVLHIVSYIQQMCYVLLPPFQR